MNPVPVPVSGVPPLTERLLTEAGYWLGGNRTKLLLEEAAARVRELEAELANADARIEARDRATLHAVFLADAMGIDGVEAEMVAAQEKVLAPVLAERDAARAQIAAALNDINGALDSLDDSIIPDDEIREQVYGVWRDIFAALSSPVTHPEPEPRPSVDAAVEYEADQNR